ncbi:MAG: hypothetical protein QW559_03525 [Candidatus Woesearchaeota archaeon]
MALGIYDWIYGIAQLAAAFLAIVSGFLALSMLNVSQQKKILKGWRWLIFAIIFFVAIEFVGALKTFGIYHAAPWLTHVFAGVVVIFLIAALATESHIKAGCTK